MNVKIKKCVTEWQWKDCISVSINVSTEKFIAFKTFTLEEKKLKFNDVLIQLKKLEKEQQSKF